MKMKRMFKKLLVMSLLVLALCGSALTVYADESDSSSTTLSSASGEERNRIRGQLNRFYTDLKSLNDISDENKKKMDKIYNTAMSYMNYADLSVSEIASYESTVEGYLKDLANKNTADTNKFLMLSNEVPITDAKYGDTAFVVLSLINLGKTDITDIVITPAVSNDKAKWPFEINQAYDAQTIQILQAADNTEDAYNKRMDIGWNFVVRQDVLTGCYPLNFHATYYQNGAAVSTDITTYINVKGSNPKNLLVPDEKQLSANPRIVVTGFTTVPETVYAGSVFNLTVNVKNTSAETTVKNVLFDLQATVEGSTTVASYSAFLPTSGSSSVYTDAIAPGETYQMSIEMEAKSDLAQKPYVLTVNMKYDTDEEINKTDTASVSIPVKQEAKMDTGTAEIMPESIAVGEQSNIMFSVFNTGKTTLYNVKVTYESDAIDSGISYLGNLDPGATGNVDSMVTGIAADDGSGTITAVVTYEDEAGNETRYEKEMNLSVYENMVDDGSMDDIYTEPAVEESSGLPLPALIGIIAAIVVIVVVIVIVIKKKKAKKQKKEMELLDDEDDV